MSTHSLFYRCSYFTGHCRVHYFSECLPSWLVAKEGARECNAPLRKSFTPQAKFPPTNGKKRLILSHLAPLKL